MHAQTSNRCGSILCLLLLVQYGAAQQDPVDSVRSSETRQRPRVELTDAGRAIHEAGFIFDGHNDLPWALRTKSSSSFKKMDISQPQKSLHTDIPRLRRGNVGAQFWSVYVPAWRRITTTSFASAVRERSPR